MQRSRLTAAIGPAIRELRQEHHRYYSQEFPATLADVHRTYMGTLESGDSNPTVAMLEKVAQALGVNVSDIILRAEGLSL